jgi:hypothetical protein
MKFQRTDLIARVKDAIAAKEAYAAERTANAAEAYETSRAEYIQNTRDSWKQLADTIRVRLRTGQPVAATDIPSVLRNGWRGGHVETWDKATPSTYEADTGPLRQLLVLLEAATDDEITTSSLERMGFRTAQLFAR